MGGGPAGLGAAKGAADAGARVILVERYGFFGGSATAALVIPMMSYHTSSPEARRNDADILFPSDHGPGEPVIAGVLAKLFNRIVELGGAIPPSVKTDFVTPFDPEVFKFAAMELLNRAGVDFLLHSCASGVIAGEGEISGVVFETKSGPLVIQAKTVVDCTGDGDISAWAGVPFESGRADGTPNPVTLMFRMIDFNREAFSKYVKKNPGQWDGVHGLKDLVASAEANGELDLKREDMLFFGATRGHELNVNSTRIKRVYGTDVWGLTYAEWEGRRQMRQIASFLSKYVPGFENASVVQSGVEVGVRSSRRIAGLYQMTAQDVLEARSFPDVIARGSYPIDIHLSLIHI